jgi:uncharacterized membrane protein
MRRMTETGTTFTDLAQRAADRAMLAVIAASTLLFGWLAYLQYARFTTETHEITYLSYALAHTGGSRFLPQYFMEQGSYWGSHLTIQWLLLLPVFKLVPTVPFLLFLQSLFISAAAWPLYLLGRHVLKNNFAAVGVATAYLFFPPVVSQHLNQLHDDQFGNVWLVLAAYLFVRRQFGWFFLPLTLACLSKEYFALTAMMFGAWALLERRGLKWILGPVVLGAGLFVLAVKVIMPSFQGPGNVAYGGWAMFLSQYGQTPAEIRQTLLTQPGRVIAETFGPDRLWYLFVFFGPVLWAVPFLSAAAVLLLPNLGMNLVTSNGAFRVLPWHYGVFLGAAVFVAVVCGLPRFHRWLTARLGVADLRLVAAGLVAVNLLSHPLWFDLGKFQKPQNYDALRHVVALVPREAAVVCTGPLLAHFTHQRHVTTCSELLARHKLGAWSNFAPNSPESLPMWRDGTPALLQFDFVVLDANWRNPAAMAQQVAFEWLQKNPASFRLVFNQQNVFVFQRLQPAAS